MPSLPKQRTRALANQGTPVGAMRYSLYKQAYTRIAEASEQGFHLEAISVIESLVSDRLESRLSFLKGHDFSFKNLGPLITEMRRLESDEDLRKLVDQDLDEWRKSRNRDVHEMAKMADGDFSTWADRAKELIPIGKKGLSCLRAIDKRYRELRRLGR